MPSVLTKGTSPRSGLYSCFLSGTSPVLTEPLRGFPQSLRAHVALPSTTLNDVPCRWRLECEARNLSARMGTHTHTMGPTASVYLIICVRTRQLLPAPGATALGWCKNPGPLQSSPVLLRTVFISLLSLF
jgi:hypothetical protein